MWPAPYDGPSIGVKHGEMVAGMKFSTPKLRDDFYFHYRNFYNQMLSNHLGGMVKDILNLIIELWSIKFIIECVI